MIYGTSRLGGLRGPTAAFDVHKSSTVGLLSLQSGSGGEVFIVGPDAAVRL